MSRWSAWARGSWGIAIWISGTIVIAADRPPAETVLDPLQWAVVNSLRHPERTTPEELLEAAVDAAAVEALEPTLEFLDGFDQTLAAAADPEGILAELGDSFPVAELTRLRRFLEATAPPEDAKAIAELIGLMQAAARQRRTDPARLARAAADLQSDSRGVRQRATETLLRGGTAALPVLVDLLMEPTPAANAPEQADRFVRTRRLTRQIVGRLGERGTEALGVWLGSGDPERFPGVLAALDLLIDRGSLPVATAAEIDLPTALLGPATNPALPEAVRQAAGSLLAKLARIGRAPVELADQPVSPATACRLLAARLDQLLSPAGIPLADSLATADSSLPVPMVEQFLWNAASRRTEAGLLSPADTRCLRGRQLAGSLAGTGCTDPAAVRLVLLAQAEALVRFGKDPQSIEPIANPEAAVAALPAELVRDVLAGPEGFAATTVADVLDEALVRELPLAAALTIRALRESATDPPLVAIQPSLVRALTAASDLVQFDAARTLAGVSPASSFPGASRMLDRLGYFAGSTGVDRVVIAHPNREVGTMLAAGLSRFGFDTTLVTSGRNCLLAVGQSPDTRLVMISSRLRDLAARELIQLLRQPALGDIRPTLVMLDPLDDDRSRRHRTRLLLTLADFDRVLLTDRLESLLLPSLDPKDETTVLQPRFPETLARVAGPQAADDNRRRQQAIVRLERAALALDLLGGLGEQGWEVTAALPAARDGLQRAETFPAALRLLAVMPVPTAQSSLLDLAMQPDLSAGIRQRAAAALEQSIGRHGILLTPSQRQTVIGMYTGKSDAGNQPLGQLITALLTPSSRPTVAADAQEPR